MSVAQPDFTIERLGPAEFPSPLLSVGETSPAFFIEDDERTLYDTTGHTWHHAEMPRHIEPVNMEVAGPRRKLFFRPETTRAAIVTCGGLCPGINNVIRGLTLALMLQYGVNEVLGIRYGYQGLVPGQWEPMVLTKDVVDRWHLLGGTLLGSSRGPQQIEEMVNFLEQRQIQILFTIGGDGTQRGALEICRAVRRRGLPIAVVGLPKTVDNDLSFVDRAFGFETAFSLADQALKAAHAEATGVFNGVGLVKLMGRHSGYITTLAALANGDVNFVLIPEVPFELDGPEGFLACLERRLAQRQHAVIALAEGAGQHLLQDEVARLGKDASGNTRLADIGSHLRKAIEHHFHSRGITVNVRYIDPSYMIRSAATTPNDSVFCLQLAHHAVHAALSGRTAMVVGTWKNTFTHIPMHLVVSQRKRVNPMGRLWLSLLQAIGQPARIGCPVPPGSAASGPDTVHGD